MQPTSLLIILICFSVFAFVVGKRQSLAIAKPIGGIRYLHSLPVYYGMQTVIWCGLPALVVLLFGMIFQSSIVNNMVMDSVSADLIPANQSEYNLLLNRIENVAYGALSRDGQEAGVLAAADKLIALQTTGRWVLTCIVSCLAIGGLLFAKAKISPQMQAREQVEKMTQMLLLGCACIAVFTTLGIVLSVVFESIRFFQMVPVTEFIFGLEWSPQVAIRADQVGSSSSFGAVPLFTGTLMVSAIAMLIAVPAGLMSAIYLSEYASSNVRNYTKPALEILAGIPTVVYGFFAALTVAPFVRELGASMGVSISSESALAAGAVMGVMIIPFISSLSDDVITAVPQSMRDGSLAMGATKSETIRNVIIPAALPGIVGGILLAVSRAIGETMIVVMAAGLAAKLTANPLETVTTVTVQIVTLLTGDQEFDSPKTLAAFALGLMLFSVTLVLNIFALRIVKKYREQYE